MYWKTITTFLLNSDPQWIKIIELSEWIGKIFIIPRSELENPKLIGREELKTPSLYFLFGERWGEKQSYIWETENLLERISTHKKDTKKDFFDIVVWVIWLGNYLNKADVRFLEYESIRRAQLFNRIPLVNKSQRNENALNESRIDTLMQFLDTVALLLSSQKILLLSPLDEKDSEELLYCNGPEAQWIGIFIDQGILVQKWSIIRRQFTPSTGNSLINLQKTLYLEWYLQDKNDDSFIFIKDYFFSSPSTAASIILARNANGWNEWRDAQGITLDTLKRK